MKEMQELFECIKFHDVMIHGKQFGIKAILSWSLRTTNLSTSTSGHVFRQLTLGAGSSKNIASKPFPRQSPLPPPPSLMLMMASVSGASVLLPGLWDSRSLRSSPLPSAQACQNWNCATFLRNKPSPVWTFILP